MPIGMVELQWVDPIKPLTLSYRNLSSFLALIGGRIPLNEGTEKFVISNPNINQIKIFFKVSFGLVN
jgi:hypothetical protein